MTDPLDQDTAGLQQPGARGSSDRQNRVLLAIAGLGALILIGFGIASMFGKEEEAETSIVDIPEQETTVETDSARAPLFDNSGPLFEEESETDNNEPTESAAETENAALRAALADLIAEQRAQREDHLAAMEALGERIDELGSTERRGRLSDQQREARRAEAEAARKAEEAAEAARLASDMLVVDAGRAAQREATLTETNSAFLDRAANRSVVSVQARELDRPGHLIPQGTMIPAILETAINSDLPGNIRARVKRDVWSADGSNLLIRKGAVLIGEYSAPAKIGDDRILIAWTRLITTDQRTIAIGSPGTDGRGVAGFGGRVDNHFPEKFEAAFFISIFRGVSSAFSARLARDDGGFSRGVQSGSDSAGEDASDSLEEYLSIPPTIWIDQGEAVNVFVNRDLYFSPS